MKLLNTGVSAASKAVVSRAHESVGLPIVLCKRTGKAPVSIAAIGFRMELVHDTRCKLHSCHGIPLQDTLAGYPPDCVRRSTVKNSCYADMWVLQRDPVEEMVKTTWIHQGGRARAQALAKPVILSTAMSVPPVQLLLHTSLTTSATAHHHHVVSAHPE